jgi:hypothetical protein
MSREDALVLTGLAAIPIWTFVVLPLGYSGASMSLKDTLTLVLSALAFALAIGSFVWTWLQRNTENRRAIRKALTEVIEELATTSIAFNQLSIDYPRSQETAVVNMRRNYNSKRRYLSVHGDFLCEEAPAVVMEPDCLILAGAFDAANNLEKAEKYWGLAVSKSSNATIRHANLRGFARYKFRHGHLVEGRELYNEALGLLPAMPDSDVTRQIIADTFLMWAAAEKEIGSEANSSRLFEAAADAANRIVAHRMKEEMLQQVSEQRSGVAPPKSQPPPATPPPPSRQFGEASS